MASANIENPRFNHVPAAGVLTSTSAFHIIHTMPLPSSATINTIKRRSGRRRMRRRHHGEEADRREQADRIDDQHAEVHRGHRSVTRQVQIQSKRQQHEP